jgi:small-conductance mechanosensitive channel
VENLLNIINSLFQTKFFSIGGADFTLASLAYLILLFTLLIFISAKIKLWILKRVEAKNPESFGSFKSIAKITHYTILLIGSIVILQSIGLDLSTFTVLVGAMGIGLGFGLQTIISNFVSGVIILFERPIKVGDRIEVGDIMGDVRDISIRATTVVTNDNIAIIVPNSDFISSKVVNWSFTDRRVRCRFHVGVSYNSDPLKIKELLLQVADEHPGLLKSPAPAVHFNEFADSSLNFTLLAWTQDFAARQSAIRSEVNFAIWKIFKEHNIEIPFPQRDVHIKSSKE